MAVSTAFKDVESAEGRVGEHIDTLEERYAEVVADCKAKEEQIRNLL